MKNLLSTILTKKSLLDSLKASPKVNPEELDQWLKIELTYTSNAIEGNTLTHAETAQVIEKGITVGGKSLQDHLEAINHIQALDKILQFTNSNLKVITERFILDLHQIILQKIDDTNSGRYRNVSVRIAGSRVIMPNAAKVSELMANFITWLHQQPKENAPETAIDTHYKLVTIHPFVDGNGRTARLIMNLVLMQSGFPPVIIPKEDRQEYLRVIEKAQLGGSILPYQNFMYHAIDKSLERSLNETNNQNDLHKISNKELLKIGEFAKLAKETVPTIRHWTQAGLLQVTEYSTGGYQLYQKNELKKAKKIRNLQETKRLTLTEIKNLV